MTFRPVDVPRSPGGRPSVISYRKTIGQPGVVGQAGFSLFEMVIVIIAIAFLLYTGMGYYQTTIEHSRDRFIRFQAATFSRVIANLHGQAIITRQSALRLENSTILFNEKGWPASSDSLSGDSGSLMSYNQSPEECEALWVGVFKSAPATQVMAGDDDGPVSDDKDFKVFSINGRICRYELVSKQEGQYFFDYDLSTGEVTVASTSPPQG